MKVTIANDREVKVGDTVRLLGQRWYTRNHSFKVGDVMTVVEDNPESTHYMTINDGVITVEMEGVKYNPNDFE